MRDRSPMEMKYSKCIVIAIGISLGLIAQLHAEAKAPAERSGRVLAATLSGHGPNPESKSKRSNRLDIWWNYCISSGDTFYSVLSRETPEKTGLKPGKNIRFTEDRKQMYIRSSRGKQFALRILRKGSDRKCP